MERMRVAIVAESFLPNVNGVTNSVLRVLEHLADTGHEALVIAPGAREGQEEIADYLGFPIVRVPTVRIPLIDSLPVGVPTTAVDEALREFKPDIIHLASPFVLGAAGAFSARQLRIPSVALYQTDVAGFATKYHASALAYATWEWLRTIHNACQMTLAPSSLTIKDLEDHHIKNVRHWGRGVDSERFHPSKRSAALRQKWGVGDKLVVGFVGRLAAEKGVHRLASLNDRKDIQLVIVGDGPERPLLEAHLPSAVLPVRWVARNSPRPMLPSTSLYTRVSSRPSARPFRRHRLPAFRPSARARAAQSISLKRATTGCFSTSRPLSRICPTPSMRC